MRSWWVLGMMMACGADKEATDDTDVADTDMADTDAMMDEAQTPPEGHEALTAWIAAGHYLDWACEPASHEARSPSPHGYNRICSNDLMSAHGDGEYPVGAAAVKELYDDGGATIVGYAVERHVAAGTSGGDWYWYEVVPLTSGAPHDENGVVADGYGDSGPAQAICVSCHSAAGADADHPGHDFVYTQVR